MRFDVMTLFPNWIETLTGDSILGRAADAGLIEVHAHQIREYSTDKHHRVDDTPYGGGMGMLMAAPPIYACFQDICKQTDIKNRRVIYLSPRGTRLTQKRATELASYDQLILLCGHYEGVDQRVLDLICDEEISIGDYVLTGGELPACVLIDTVARLIPGVLADPICHTEESFSSGLLEYPQYTRPRVFEGMEVPEVLQSGDHQKIAAWRLTESLKITKQNRPDLL